MTNERIQKENEQNVTIPERRRRNNYRSRNNAKKENAVAENLESTMKVQEKAIIKKETKTQNATEAKEKRTTRRKTMEGEKRKTRTRKIAEEAKNIVANTVEEKTNPKEQITIVKEENIQETRKTRNATSRIGRNTKFFP